MSHYNLTQLRGAWGAGYAAAEKRVKSDLVGMFILTFEDGVMEKQGHVIGKENESVYRVQWFSWLFGDPTNVTLVDVEAMMDWRFYATHAEWVSESQRELHKLHPEWSW